MKIALSRNTLMPKRLYSRPSLLLICVLLLAVLAYAATPVHTFQEVAISPDATRVAWVAPAENAAGELIGGSAIYLADPNSPNSKPSRISAVAGGNAAASEDYIAWSPDSKQIAFISDVGADAQAQLYVAQVSNGVSRKLTTLTGALADPAWSPDGRSIAFLFTENAPGKADPLLPMLPETGVIAGKIFEQRLAVVDVASGRVSQLSPADLYVYEFDWSPDSKSFALLAAPGAGDANWYVAQLYTLSVAAPELKPIYQPRFQIACPRWSPDGKNIAFISGLMSDEGFIGGDIFVAPASGGAAHNLTPEIAASPATLYWRTPGEILFTEHIDGDVGISTLDLADGKVSTVWTWAGIITTDEFRSVISVSLASDRQTSAVIRHSWKQPPEIWTGPVGQWKQMTHSNPALSPPWGEIKSLHWSSDGMKIQGWLVYPKDYDPSRRYPMVVVPHGGPAGTVNTGWPEVFFNTLELSTHGYFVLNPNPRGSYGQGEKFTEANIKDFGYGDFRDILAGVDEVVKTLPVDDNRIGITGWSYGGYMTMWAVTQTHRFRAAVSGAGLANWQSYYGENDIDEWMIPYFGASVYDDPAVYARSAPITFIKNAKTPTLLLVGERDGECPAPQSREFWHALKTLGVPTELVIYPGEGHAFLQLEHQQDVMERVLAWFDHYLKN
ncbi:Peptidase, S9C (Acylaminoacyl-peptidase) family [Verrucomicrobia bacterium]|nr:Peptidase, S9C (Acylaminoacyl-peptidase) family [Verrucomicrobiota bacterium]